MSKPIVRVKQRFTERWIVFTVTVPGLEAGCFISESIKKPIEWMKINQKLIEELNSGKRHILRKDKILG